MSTSFFSLDDTYAERLNKNTGAEVAQPVEQRIRNAWVVSSNLILGSSFCKKAGFYVTTCQF